MAEIKVEDLMRSIRKGAGQGAALPGDREVADQGSSATTLGRLETNLMITGRTHNQLPPVTTYRSGLLARAELWIKRQLKRTTHWYTWEQVNFNSSVHTALKHVFDLLHTYEQRLAKLQNELDASVTWKSNLEARLSELESTLALTESRFDGLLAEKTAELRIEHRRHVELLLDEQRVCFKQLALEISEAAVVDGSTRRSTQLRLERLANRVNQVTAEQSEGKNVSGPVSSLPSP